MTLDVIFQACDEQLVQSFYGAPAFSSLATADVSEAQMFTATAYIESMYGDDQSGRYSRAQTPMAVSCHEMVYTRVLNEHELTNSTGL
jgi:succinate--hydroxymethylglutarate CoA-transferase